jgi:FKBP-type peptidyl-prolyl cis-trans isomerase (trigger factor)
MKIISQKREGNRVLLEVEEGQSEFKKAVDRAIVEAGKEIKLPGFRPGKAPKEMIEKALDPQAVQARAAQALISDLYPRIIDETGIEPVDYPAVEILDQKKTKPFVFKITVDVYPEVKLGKYKGLKAEKKSSEVTDEEIDKVLKDTQARFAAAAPDGNKDPLPLDDEFAKKVSRFNTLEELRAELRGAMTKDREAGAEADLKDKLIAAASAEAQIEIPDGMVRREVDVMLDELRNSLAQSRLSLEDYLKGIRKEEAALREEFGKTAGMRVKGKLVLRAIADAEKMEIAEAELDAELKTLSQASGEAVEDIKKRLDEGAKKYIEDYMLRRKSLDFIIEKAKIKSASA